MLENHLAIEGEYATEKTMREDWNWSEILISRIGDGIINNKIHYFEKHPWTFSQPKQNLVYLHDIAQDSH